MGFGVSKAELETQVADLQGQLDEMQPFAAVAREINDQYQALGQQASLDPTQLPSDIYDAAVKQ